MTPRAVRLLPRSIRGRLLLTVLAAVVVTALLVTMISVQVIAGFLNSRLHQRIDTIAEQIGNVANQAPDRIADATALRTFLPAGSLVLLESDSGEKPVGFGSDDLDRAVISRTANSMSDGDFRRLTVTSPTETALTVAVVRVDTEGLQIQLEGLAEPVTTHYIVFATDISEDVAAVTRLLWLECVMAAVVILVVGVVSALIIRIGIKPLTTMAATADEITRGNRRSRLALGTGFETDHLAASVNQALDAQQIAEDRLRTFLDDVSHELRTPLTTINGWIDLYLQGGLQVSSERDRAMERVEAEISRMRTLVDELTLLSRLDAHRPLDAAPVDLAEVAAEVVDDARIVADDREITLEAHLVFVTGDPARLAQVLRNLIGNAVQHTPTGTSIDIRVRQEGDEAVITVRDDGPGIDADDLSHIFERFWRAEPSRSRATGGSGLGLAIVASIIEAHGGAIRVTSIPGNGTTFTVSFPTRHEDEVVPRDQRSWNSILTQP